MTFSKHIKVTQRLAFAALVSVVATVVRLLCFPFIDPVPEERDALWFVIYNWSGSVLAMLAAILMFATCVFAALLTRKG